MTDGPIDQEIFSELQEAMGADFADELVTTFLDEAPGMMAELRLAAANEDADGFRRAAHSIKSNAAIFGAQDLAAQARALELGGLPGDGGAALAALDAVQERALAALRGLLND